MPPALHAGIQDGAPDNYEVSFAMKVRWLVPVACVSVLAACGSNGPLKPDQVLTLDGSAAPPAERAVSVALNTSAPWPNSPVERQWAITITKVNGQSVTERHLVAQLPAGEYSFEYTCWAKASVDDVGGMKGSGTSTFTLGKEFNGQSLYPVIETDLLFYRRVSLTEGQSSGSCNIKRLSNENPLTANARGKSYLK